MTDADEPKSGASIRVRMVEDSVEIVLKRLGEEDVTLRLSPNEARALMGMVAGALQQTSAVAGAPQVMTETPAGKPFAVLGAPLKARRWAMGRTMQNEPIISYRLTEDVWLSFEFSRDDAKRLWRQMREMLNAPPPRPPRAN